MKIYCFSPFGYEGAVVSIEIDLRRGIPAIDIVGLADSSVKESRERMRVAIINSGFEFPMERILISLSPADVKKEGSCFDLAIALAVLAAKEKSSLFADSDLNVLILGELELSGKVKHVKGVYAAVATAFENGITHCIVPKENAKEASMIVNSKIFAAESLKEAFLGLKVLAGNEKSENIIFNEKIPSNEVEFSSYDNMDFADIIGQENLVRGLQIAAAGGHHTFIYGPPGCGKTLAISRFRTLLPLLSFEETQTVMKIYSLAGFLTDSCSEYEKMRIPPFRNPHQSASFEGIIGGGKFCTPGEVSLAHNGVLFLDEGSEFSRNVLQSLRVPLETGCITLSRAGRHTCFPASFQLIVASNPCPCGNFGDSDKICICSMKAVEQFWRKFSAPLLDRMDIKIQVFQCKKLELGKNIKGISTGELRKQIALAYQIQKERQNKKNVDLTVEEINQFCVLSDSAKSFLSRCSENENFSGRGLHGLLKVARTIADMNGESLINDAVIEEAHEYRKSKGVLDIMR